MSDWMTLLVLVIGVFGGIYATPQFDNATSFELDQALRSVPENYVQGRRIGSLRCKDPDYPDDILDIRIMKDPSYLRADRFQGAEAMARIYINKILNYEESTDQNSIAVEIRCESLSKKDRFVNFESKLILEDVNDVAPVFQKGDVIAYEFFLDEDLGPTITLPFMAYSDIKVFDGDGTIANKIVEAVCEDMQVGALNMSCDGYFEVRARRTSPGNYIFEVYALRRIYPNPNYVLNILAKNAPANPEGGETLYSPRQNVIIRINDIQNMPPVIPIETVQYAIFENQPLGVFGTVKANDQDRGDPHAINFTLAIYSEEPYGFEQDFFELGPAKRLNDDIYGADLILKNPLDREAIPDASDVVYVTLIAQEYDPLGRPNRNEMSATALISVQVKDINDEKPTFQQDYYSVTVPEVTGPIPEEQVNDNHQLLANLVVTDKDSKSYNSFELEFISGNENGIFSLNSYNGSRNEGFILYIKKGALDYETNKNSYTVVIKATDINRSDLTSTAVVDVKIIDVNDNRPQFDNAVLSFNVPENSEGVTLIGQVTATDADQGDTITYGLQGDSIFYIDDNGNLYLNGTIDYETRPSYQVSVTATDKANQQEQITVTIVVINVNDDGPKFPASGYVSFLYEESLDLNPTITIQATSAETGETIVYGLESVNPPELTGYFALDPISGTLTVLQFIDYKQTESGIIILEFSATAGSLKSITQGTITVQDSNNYAPEFQPPNTNTYYTTISELARPGDSVYQMSVIDRDGPDTPFGKVYFQIVQGSYDQFRIGFESGEVVLAANASLDTDETPTYNLVIKARDDGNPLKSSTATLVVNVLDDNNKPPQFKETVLVTTVKEGTPPGSDIVTVEATDPDRYSVLEYSLSFSQASFRRQSETVTNFINGSQYFSINNQGMLKVAGDIRRNLFDRVTFKIIAEDVNITIGQPRQTATVDIRVTVLASDEQRIYFTTNKGAEINPTLTKDFSETPVGGSIAQIFSLRAIDPKVSREIRNFREAAGYDPEDYLSVNQSYVILRKELDYEALPGGPAKNLTTVVLAISDDGQRTGTATIIINVLDINDNRPVFEQRSYNMSVDEDKPSPTRIGIVRATDADSSSYGQVSYRLSGPNNADFQIFTEKSGGNYIGVIRIAPNVSLDYETTSQYNLQVIASDYNSGSSSDRLRSTAALIITVNDKNDNAPVFREDEYYFTAVGTSERVSVGVVIADDKDRGQNGNVEYYIQSSTGSGKSYFSIKTKAEKSAQPGQTFNVGVLNVRSSLADLPEGIRFEMVVIARDNAAGSTQLTGQAIVYITVSKGARDPKPIWDNNLNTTVNILENSPVGTFVADITARPANSSSSIQYKFVTSGNNFGDWQNFLINPDTGRITVNGDLDFEKQKVYSDTGEGYVRNMDLLILATDTSNSSLTNQFLLVVKIVDVDDNDPSFTSCEGKTYPIPVEASVLETLEAPVFVYQAVGCDLDTDAYNKMQYSWYYDDTYCDPSTARVFSLNADDGKIYTKIMLDRETTPEYLLCIQVDIKPVTNGRRKRSMVSDLRARDNHDTVLYVRVIVKDVNDNGASFREQFKQTVILEYPQIVGVAEAEDPDLPPNNDIRYSIDSIEFTKDGKTQSQPSAFSINGDDGTIVVGLDDYSDFAGGYFEIVVRASDRYNGDLYDKQTQKVYVTNKVNQIRVVFDEPADQQVQQKAINMINELNGLNRGFYQVKKISYHTIDNDRDPVFDKTDVCMVVMKYDNVLTATDGAKEMNQQEEFQIIRKYGARDPGPCEPAKSVYPEGWESYWWVLVAFAIFIFILVLILIVLICILHRQYKRYMETRRTYLVPGN